MKILNRVSKYDRAAHLRVRPDQVLIPQSLDFLLKYTRKHPIPRPLVFRQRLLELLKHKSRPAGDEVSMGKLLSSMPYLRQDPELGLAAIAWLAEALGMRRIPKLDKEIRLLCENYYKARVLQCLTLKALTAVMPRQKALAYFEGFLAERYKSFKLSKLKQVREKLGLHEEVKRGALKDGAVFLQGMTDDGRAVMKITRCRPAEVLLREIKDPQIVHAVICQPDFLWAKLNNPAFELTRQKSLALGMPYCGHVWHDKRVHKVIKHPSRKFWEALN